MTRRAVLICPGRGTYNRTELGYINKNHGDDNPLLARFDALRDESNQTKVSVLDAAKTFSNATYSNGENASPLIYSCSLLDCQTISPDIDVVAVTGNSLGWYIALAAGGALTEEHGFRVVNGMGRLMQTSLIGGQLVYPFVDDEWRDEADRQSKLREIINEIDAVKENVLTVSIQLGGMLVLAGNEQGLAAFEAAVPKLNDRFPMRLPNHAAFHSHLQKPISKQALAKFTPEEFEQPKFPLIDGRGAIWWPQASDPTEMWQYTFGHQIIETYDFSRAVQVAAQEFAPDLFVLTGPGNTLGGAVAQSLIDIDWEGLSSKSDFVARQKTDPIVVSMGLEEQRKLVS